MLTRALLLCAALAAVTGCTEVDPSNPFDPGTPAEQQAAGTVTGALVLPPGFGAARLGDGAVELWRGDDEVARIALSPEADSDPPRAPFAFESVVGGRYTLKAAVPGLALSPVVFELAIGESLPLGDLALIPAEQGVPRGIRGVAKRAGGGADGHGGIRVDVVDTPYAAVTTAQGDFQLELAPASYTLRFSADGHETETVSDLAVTPEGYTVLPSEVVLQGAAARLYGRVAPPVGFDGAFDFAEVRVGLWAIDAAADAEPTAAAPVDARGDFDLPGLESGRYRLQALREGFVGTLAAVTVAPGQALEVPGLTLQAVEAELGLLSGVARLGGAQDHSNIRVELVGSELGATTNADGDWAFQAPPGVHTLRVTRAGFGTAQIEAPRLQAGGAALVDEVVLTADPGAVRGQVRIDPAFGGRELLPQVAVRLARIEGDGTLSAAGESGVQPAPNDPELGTFAFEDLVPGAYQVEVSLEGFQPAYRAVEVAPGAATPTGVIFLSPNAAEAVVLGRARRDCADCDHGGIRVEAVGTPFITLTNGDGDFRLAVTDGQFSLRYSAPGHGTQVGAPIAVNAGAPVQAPPVVLVAQPAVVTAQVLRVDGVGRQGPAVGATLTVSDAEGAALAAGPVGEEGRVALPVGTSGAATVTVSLPRHRPISRDVVLVSGQAVNLGELLLDLERGELRGEVSAPALARGLTVTVVAAGAVGDEVTAGLRRTVTPPPGDGEWSMPQLPAGGWVVTAIATEHLPSAPRAVQLGLGQILSVDVDLVARDVRIDAAAVVTEDAVAVTVAGDADLTHARAWQDGEPGPFQALEGGALQVPLGAEDGAYAFQVQAGNGRAANPAQAGDLLAYASDPLALTVVRDTTAPDVWAVDAPALVTAPSVALAADCRDALAPSDALTVAVTVDGAPAFEGPFAPRVQVPLPAEDGEYVVEATCTDWAGHVTEPLARAVRLDRAGPTVQTFQVGDGTPNLVQAQPRAVVTVALEDAGQAVATAIEEGALDCANANYRWPAGGTFVVALPAGDGPRRLSLCAIDRAGNTTGPIQSNPFIIDSQAPAAGRLFLADGAAYVRAPQVALRVDADEPGLVLKLDGDVAPVDSPADAWPAQVELLGDDGPKLVTGRLMDAAGNTSLAFSDTVTLDRQPPAAGRVTVADGLAEVNRRLIPISLAETNPDTMRFWEGDPAQACAPVACGADGFVPFSPATNLTLSAAQGPKRVCWQLCDLAGNSAPVGQQDLSLGIYLPRPEPELVAIDPAVIQAFDRPAQFTVTGARIAADTELVIGDFVVPCEGGGEACQADPAQGCANACTARLPGAVLGNAGTYPVSLRTPAPGGGRSDVLFLSIVAPLATVVDLSPRGLTPFREDGQRLATVELTILGYNLLDNTTYRLENVSGEVIDDQPLERADLPRDVPTRMVTVRFDAGPLPVPRDGRRLTLSVTNPSPGGGTIEVPVGWNPRVAECDVSAGCRSQLDRFRTPSGGGAVSQAYDMAWPSDGAVAWRGGQRARLLVEDQPAGLAAVALSPVETLSVPLSLGEGLILEGPPTANPGVDLTTVPWRTSGDFRANDIFDPEYLNPLVVPNFTPFVQTRDLTGDGWPEVVAVGPEQLNDARVGISIVSGGPGLLERGAPVTVEHRALGAGVAVALATGDLDGNDWPDVIIALQDGVMILRGEGGGLAPTQRLVHEGPAFVAMATADFDGDGRVDARIVDVEGRLYSLTRSFAGAIELTALPLEQGRTPLRTLTAGDVDGDGRPDLVGVTAPADGPPVIVSQLSSWDYLETRSSAEAPVWPHPELTHVIEVGNAAAAAFYPDPKLALADLDGDGALDAVHNDIGSQMRVYRGLGDGRFELIQTLPRGNGGPNPAATDARAFALVDANGDGRVDLLYGRSANLGNFNQAVAAGRGDGTFSTPEFRNDDSRYTGGKSLAVHDLNRDGLLDLVMGRSDHPELRFWRGAGGQPMDRVRPAPCDDGDPCRDRGMPTTVYDVNGDGRDDLVFTTVRNGFGFQLGTALADGGGNLQRPRFGAFGERFSVLGEPLLGPWGPEGRLVAFAVSDLGDRGELVRLPIDRNGQPGAPEVVLGADPLRRAALLLARPRGGWWLVDIKRAPGRLVYGPYDPDTNRLEDAQTLQLPADPLGRPLIRVADLDGDGDDDLVLLLRGGAVMVEQRDDALVQRGPEYGPCADEAAVGDLDGDGHLDVVLGRFLVDSEELPGCASEREEGDGNGGQTVLWGDGRFGFQAQPIGGLSYQVDVADMDGDGLDDLVLGVGEPLPLAGAQLSRPDRTFAPLLLREMPVSPVNVRAADLDGDGVVDVAQQFSNVDQAGARTNGWTAWRRPAPTTHRLEAGGPLGRRIPPGVTSRPELSSERRYFEQVGLTVQLTAAAEIDPNDVVVRLRPPGSDEYLDLPAPVADGLRLRLHAPNLDVSGWLPDGAWRVEIANRSGQELTLTEARVITVGGWTRALE